MWGRRGGDFFASGAYFGLRVIYGFWKAFTYGGDDLEGAEPGYRFGFEIMEVTGLPSGTVYPALRRLERDGMVSSEWEPEAEALGEPRPARRYYELTKLGKEAETMAVRRYPLLARLLPEKLGKTV